MNADSTWQTIAPIENTFCLPDHIELPIRLTDRISISALPSWIYDPAQVNPQDQLHSRLVSAIVSRDSPCFLVEYTADSLGDPDPEWKGPQPRSKQDRAFEEIQFAHFALWLQRPTSLNFRHVADAVHNEGEWLIRNLARHDPPKCLACDLVREFEFADFEAARALLAQLTKIPRAGPVWFAVLPSIRALTEPNWDLRFLLFWIALESLFGPEDGRETTFRLSQRVGLFLGNDDVHAKELFEKVKRSYGWRSKLVHGFRLAKLKDKEAEENIELVELTARRSIARILGDPKLREVFNTKQREDYLDALAFS